MKTQQEITEQAGGKPTVSVVLPTYNRETTIARAIRSVLGQTFTDFELIVVDDASTDDTRRVVASIADPRVRYVCLESNRGACAARNAGIDLANADLIAFQDSDDEWLPSKLETQIALLHARGADFGASYTNFIRIREGQSVPINWSETKVLDGNILLSLLHISFVSTQTLLARADVIRRAGKFDPSMPRHQDWDLVLRMARITKFAFVPEPMAVVYETPNNISSNPRADIIGKSRIVEKISGFTEIDLGFRNRCVAKHLYMMGRTAMRMGEGAEARGFIWSAIRQTPGRIRFWAALALTSFVPRGSMDRRQP